MHRRQKSSIKFQLLMTLHGLANSSGCIPQDSKTIQDIDAQLNNAREAQDILPKDLLWNYGKWKVLENVPGWNGFYEDYND